jgi:hypothetical protein
LSIPFSEAVQKTQSEKKKIILCDFFTAFVSQDRPRSELMNLRAALVAAVDAGHKVYMTSQLCLGDVYTELARLNLDSQFPCKTTLDKLSSNGKMVVTHAQLSEVLERTPADIYINRESGPAGNESRGISCKLFIHAEDGQAGLRLRHELGLGAGNAPSRANPAAAPS